MEIRGIPYHRS